MLLTANNSLQLMTVINHLWLNLTKIVTNDHTLILFLFLQKLSFCFEPKDFPYFHVHNSSLDSVSWQFMNVSSDASFQLVQWIWGRLRDLSFSSYRSQKSQGFMSGKEGYQSFPEVSTFESSCLFKVCKNSGNF